MDWKISLSKNHKFARISRISRIKGKPNPPTEILVPSLYTSASCFVARPYSLFKMDDLMKASIDAYDKAGKY
jgi:hypothetical protein